MPITASSSNVASLVYTSGTTGNPKAVELTHNSVREVCAMMHARIPLDERTRLVSYLPLSHIAAMGIDVYSAIYCGSFLLRPFPRRRGDSVASIAPRRWRRVGGVAIPEAVTASPTQAPKSTSPTPWLSKGRSKRRYCNVDLHYSSACRASGRRWPRRCSARRRGNPPTLTPSSRHVASMAWGLTATSAQVQGRGGLRRQQGEEGDWHSGEESGRPLVARAHS